MIGPESKHSQRALLPLATILVALSTWQIFSDLWWAEPKLLPSPVEVGSALVGMTADGTLWLDILSSLRRTSLGFMLGSIGGILLGLMTGRSALGRHTIGNLINLLRPVPAIALVPLAIVWLGLGESSKIFTITWGVFFPIWISTHVGTASVNIEHIWVAQSLGATPRIIFFEIILPGAATSILAGMRTGISIAFICLVAAEMAGASSGIGFRISISHLVFRVDQMIASIVVLGLLGALADRLFVGLVHLLFPWYKRSVRNYQGD